MAHCPYIYVVNEVPRPCLYDETTTHSHTHLINGYGRHGSPTGWKLPSDFKGTALTPVVTTSGNYNRALYRLEHAHSRDGRCLKNTFVLPEDCPVVEKADSEKQQPCDYEYHLLSNGGKVEKYPCVGLLGHEEKWHKYDLGDGIERWGNVRNAWHKKPAEPCPEKTDSEENSVARVDTHYRVVLKVRNPQGDVSTHILREFRTEESALEALKNTSLHVLSAEIQKRTVTTIETDWEALG